MMLVVADDLTGAAEVAAIAWQHGLDMEVCTSVEPTGQAQMLVIDTNTRNLTSEQASLAMKILIDSIGSTPGKWLFKKTDSLLRGNIVAEISVILDRLKMDRCILAPANPSMGRVIRGGRYYVDGIPLDQTDLADDPLHPTRSSNVLELLGQVPGVPIRFRSPDRFSGDDRGIVVAQAEDMAQLACWSRLVDNRTLAAGGADFFRTVLQRQAAQSGSAPAQDLSPRQWPRLFICGSRSAQSHQFLVQARQLRMPVHLMPADLTSDPKVSLAAIDRWAGCLLDAIRCHNVAAVGIPRVHTQVTPMELATRMAELAYHILSEVDQMELFIEGGNTARAVVDRMGWRRLCILGQYGPGVVRMRAIDRQYPHIVLKPGSYVWPQISLLAQVVSGGLANQREARS
ncbi:MAG: four-carbon acid sugar kinase family protein [Sedimentisphaerales bacterium]|nr:four-carbon acid sugar kinase family protein [Sedimentisphaerales bacterium]